ncbi:MAG: hypothetical protein AAF443_01285 [Chlamydiota bacterium]
MTLFKRESNIEVENHHFQKFVGKYNVVLRGCKGNIVDWLLDGN